MTGDDTHVYMEDIPPQADEDLQGDNGNSAGPAGPPVGAAPGFVGPDTN